MITAHAIERYEQITRNTIAIAFFGTPHRGAELAKFLRGLLNITFSETRFVKDLSPASQSIKEINDGFGDRTNRVQLASFWESIGMPVVGVRPWHGCRTDMNIDRSPRILCNTWIPWRDPGSLEWGPRIDD
jgi:hypothetical protein